MISLDKVLLVFLNELDNVKEFNNIIESFNNNNYYIYSFNNVKQDDSFMLDSLPDIVNHYRLQHNEISNLAVLSNSKDLIFTWFRCYNSLANDFIYFIDSDEKNYINDKEPLFSFINKVSNFVNIENETIEGKLFVNLNFSNFKKVINTETVFKYFHLYESFENFNFSGKNQKKQKEKKYLYDGSEFYFLYDAKLEKQRIPLDIEKNNEIIINQEYINKLKDNYYIIPYLAVLAFKMRNDQLNALVVQIFLDLKKNKSISLSMYQKLLHYITYDSRDLDEQLYIFSLLIIINDGTDDLSRVIMRLMGSSELTIAQFCNIIGNLQFYQSKDNIPVNDNYYVEMRALFNRLSKDMLEEKKLTKETPKIMQKENRLVFVVDQLLLIEHSPTKMIIDYVNNFIKFNRNYKIKIFIEDNLYCTNTTGIPYSYTSIKSVELAEEHRKYIESDAVEIIYPDLRRSKRENIQSFFNEIIEFGPKCVITTSKISLLSNMIYEYFPVLYLTFGGINLTRADINLTGDSTPWLELGKRTGLFDDNSVMIMHHGFSFDKEIKSKIKIPVELIRNKFVMTTVGNRLESELPQNFIDLVVRFIKRNTDSIWILVGTNKIQYIETNYPHLLSNNRIIFVEYENNLSKFYEKCDVYLNPPTPGRGFSIAMAMNKGVPIISFPNSGGTKYIGEKNLCGNDDQSFIDEIEKIYSLPEYKAMKSKKMQTRITKYFSMESAINALNMYMDIAKEKRIGAKNI